jgi:hypothetical protein
MIYIPFFTMITSRCTTAQMYLPGLWVRRGPQTVTVAFGIHCVAIDPSKPSLYDPKQHLGCVQRTYRIQHVGSRSNNPKYPRSKRIAPTSWIGVAECCVSDGPRNAMCSVMIMILWNMFVME